jgi:hypothetical protein
VGSTPFRYQSPEEDSARWLGFPFRDGDIVISTRSKTGTTWVQMICALLVFQTPDLPAPLGQLSPWLDHLIAPRDQVYARLAAPAPGPRRVARRHPTYRQHRRRRPPRARGMKPLPRSPNSRQP